MDDEFLHSGIISFMDEDYKTSIDQFTKGIEKNQNVEDALFYRGCAYIKLGNYSNAISDFSESAKTKGETFELLYSRSKAYFLNLDNVNGQKDLDKISAFDSLSDDQIEKIKLLNKYSN
jgi:tetratricopeptide (TPR) repeat protein